MISGIKDKVKKGAYVGDCERCELMLMDSDKRCPRCGKSLDKE